MFYRCILDCTKRIICSPRAVSGGIRRSFIHDAISFVRENVIWSSSLCSRLRSTDEKKYLRKILNARAKNLQCISRTGRGQNLKRRNIEWFIFRNFKFSNIKITKDELFDSFIIELIFFPFNINYLNNQNI